jgi:orotidine-5'-phosphate decarboxylase
MLTDRQDAVNSLVCGGLDPLPEKMPTCIDGFKYEWQRIAYWMCRIADAIAPYVSMFKPQRAHYEAITGGELALRRIVRHIQHEHPRIPIFLDCKRGDIGGTQTRYRIAQFELDGVDGMNFAPYMGKDCMSALYDPKHPGRAIVGLCYTSNPAAREIQDIRVETGDFFWEFIAKKIHGWAYTIGVNENAGLVMAAAHEKPTINGEEIFSYHLRRVRELVGNDLWFLIPGIGTQGGFVEETVQTAYVGSGSIAINSSSGIIFASSEEDYAEAAGAKAKALRDQIRSAMK